MTELELMLSGKLYIGDDLKLKEMFLRKCEFLDEFNSTKYNDFKKREDLVRNIFERVGKNIIINKPFHCDYGSNISIGDNFYANFDCIILDVNKVNIGNNVFFAPRVGLYTAGHPIDKDVRNTQLEYGKPIKIGDDVWIGANSIVLPGVTIGNNVVIGAGSVVNKDIPDNVVACGNPCKVIRKINDDDKRFWNEKKDEYFKLKKEK